MSQSQQQLSKLAFKMPKLIILIYHALRMIGCIIPNFYCIPGYVFLNFILLPLYLLSLRTYSIIENFLYYSLLYIVSWWSYGCGMVVHEHGDDIYSLRNDPNVKVLLVANHQSTADVPMMFQAFSSKSQWKLLWIMDIAFKWTNFGIVSQIHGDYFLKPKNYIPDSILKHCLKPYSLLKDMIIIFPEGGFRYKRLESSQSFANKKNFPQLKMVSYPRVNGYLELLNEDLNITHLVDLTICYDDPDTVPSILDIVKGIHQSDIHFYYKIYPINEYENIASDDFLYELWHKKEALLRNHYKFVKEMKLKQQNRLDNNDIHTKLLNNHNDDVQIKPSSPTTTTLRKREVSPPTTPSKLSSSSTTTSSINENGSINNGTTTTATSSTIDDDQEQNFDNNHHHNNHNHNHDGDGNNLIKPSIRKFKSYEEFEHLKFDLTKGGRKCYLNFYKVLILHLKYILVTILFYCTILWIISLFH